MTLCFIAPQNAIRVIADSVGREARRQILGEVVRAWVDEIPDSELESHYAKAVADLDEHDLSLLAAWHAQQKQYPQGVVRSSALIEAGSSLNSGPMAIAFLTAGRAPISSSHRFTFGNSSISILRVAQLDAQG